MKYDPKGPFMDPVVRCIECQKVLPVVTLNKHGSCECGNRRVRQITTMTPEERTALVDAGVDDEFLLLFEEA